MTNATHDSKSLNGFRRIRLLAGKFAFLVLAAFAAGTAWGATYFGVGGADPLYLNADGSLSVGTVLGYGLTSETRQFDFNLYYGLDGDSVTNIVRMYQTGPLKPGTSSAAWPSVNFTTEPVPGIASCRPLWLFIEYKNTIYGTGTAAPSAAQDLTTTSQVYRSSQTYFRGFRVCWTNYDPKSFIISGTVVPERGYVSARLTYRLNASSLDAGTTVSTIPLNATDGSFEFRIPFSGMTDKLLWKVEIIDGNGDAELYEDPFGNSVFTTTHSDEEHVEYTWTGAGDDDRWSNVTNWNGVSTKGFDPGATFGYPGLLAADNYRRSYVWFRSDAEVDLEGQKYTFLDDGDLYIAPNITVTLKNGKLGLRNSPYTMGANGTTVVLDGVTIADPKNDKWTEDIAGSPIIDFAAGSTVVFAGTTTATWQFRATKDNANIVFRDGTIKTRYSTSTAIKDSTLTLITNAIWQTTAGDITKKTGYTTTFRDGPDRQAQFICSAAIDLYGEYNVKIPAKGHSKPTIQAKTVNSTTTTTASFIVYVDDYLSDERVPLVKFTATASTDKNNNTSRISTQIANTSGNNRIILYARTGDDSNYKDVTARRNARLVWDSTAQTLYYQQDKVPRPTMIFLQ